MGKQLTKYRTALVSIAFAAVGFLMIWLGLHFGADHTLWDDLLISVGQTLLVGGATSVVYEHILRSKMTDLLHENNVLQRQVDSIGLAAVEIDLHGHDFTDLLTNQSNVIVLINNGRTWSTNNLPLLRRRYEKPGYRTEFIVMHPDSPCLEHQALKEEKRPDEFRSAIDELLRNLVKAGATNENTTVYGHDYFSPQSVYLCEDYAIVTPYYTAPGKDRVPFYRYVNNGKHGYFAMLKRDLEKMRDPKKCLPLRLPAKGVAADSSLSASDGV